ncbi:M20 family metallopeptidase [Methanocalculus taiwanensis]|uniref:Probable succinyl-diaminopimelate desuccinylase n=1 Tax=Methanocalculus taiwanensis TaxID=106207 RepID=A0ABD4TGH7_9EURY|nr:ArgE/DapE family deacylase [Methanocalculus taiwanensis]MCQ1537611.1 M20 family metallopeptidase [Methanocalculus taiwanensis]
MDPVRICSELIRINSENPPGITSDVIEYLSNLLSSLGIATDTIENAPGHCNLITRRQGDPLLLCGHVDVVPALDEGWTHPPYSGFVDDTFVWGRGSTDMKGGCAAIIAAIGELIDTGHEPAVSLAFVCDEEVGGPHGIHHLLEKELILPSDCIIAEPTPAIAPCIGQKGLYRFSMTFNGTPGHSSLYPAIGTSAVMEALKFLGFLKSLHEREFPIDPAMAGIIDHSERVLETIFQIPNLRSVLTRIMYNPGIISGGEKANIVAQKCVLEVDLRLPFGCDAHELQREIQSLVPDVNIQPSSVWNPSLTPPDAGIVHRICNQIGRTYGITTEPIVQWAASDARELRKKGFDVVEYGPGDIRTLHAIDERVRHEDLRKAVEVYSGVILSYDEGHH